MSATMPRLACAAYSGISCSERTLGEASQRTPQTVIDEARARAVTRFHRHDGRAPTQQHWWWILADVRPALRLSRRAEEHAAVTCLHQLRSIEHLFDVQNSLRRNVALPAPMNVGGDLDEVGPIAQFPHGPSNTHAEWRLAACGPRLMHSARRIASRVVGMSAIATVTARAGVFMQDPGFSPPKSHDCPSLIEPSARPMNLRPDAAFAIFAG